MRKALAFLSIPGLREGDAGQMPQLASLAQAGGSARLVHGFPAVTWPSQCAVLTGKRPNEHGVVANGFFWRDQQRIEMWTSWNEVIQSPQIWDLLKKNPSPVRSAAWFPMLSKGCGADYVCMPAPIHQPDGSEELWCYTKPQEFYGQLMAELGHFPLHHFWGPLASIASSRWIADSAVIAAAQFAPQFLYIYLPHLDYAYQKHGPSSAQAALARSELDQVCGKLADGLADVYEQLTWMIASEYVITDVDHVTYPNRQLRAAGLLSVRHEGNAELIDLQRSAAWAMVDHQFAHVFVRQRDAGVIQQVAKLFAGQPGIERVLVGPQRAELQMDHPRSGDVILISSRNSWQAYYWWLDDRHAPPFARTMDIHNKPGYDPVELCFDMATRSVPLDATLIRGSHGAPVTDDDQKGVVLASDPQLLPRSELADIDLHHLILNHLLQRQFA